MTKVYVIGSLRNPKIPEIGNALRETLPKWEVFEDWFSAGETADDSWKAYEQAKGHTYEQALTGYAAKHVFQFDKYHLDTSSAVVLVLPAGKSGHMELGYCLGRGIPGYILLEEGADPRWDVMYQFANGVYSNLDELVRVLTDN